MLHLNFIKQFATLPGNLEKHGKNLEFDNLGIKKPGKPRILNKNLKKPKILSNFNMFSSKFRFDTKKIYFIYNFFLLSSNFFYKKTQLK